MANSLLTVSMITRYSIPLFMNSNLFMMSINRDYDDQFGIEGAKIGAQLRIRIPNDYSVTDGPGIVAKPKQLAWMRRHCFAPGGLR